MKARPAVPPEIVAAMGAEPTEEQWSAISMPLEPFVIVAGAGSGKTSVMAARVVYLALVALGRATASHPGVLPGNVLCLTFTNKATENLTLRVRHALSAVDLAEGEEPTVLNYHGFAAHVLERHGLLAGIEPGQRVLTSAQRVELCARVLDEITFKKVKAEWQPRLIERILTLADQAANHRVSPERIIEFNRERIAELRKLKSGKTLEAAEERVELAEAVHRFQEMKRELGVIDFGDQITLALDVALRFAEVATDYQARYQTAVLDEYQDTNVAQASLIAAVFGGGFPLTAVGDPDQNIYAWRGASLYNLFEFQRQFGVVGGGEAAKLPLYTNFRSGSRILAAADHVIAPLPPEQRPDPDKELRPWAANGEGEVELVKLLDEWAEAQWIADRVLAIRSEERTDAFAWSDVAVLCRKSRLFVPLREAFSERGIPVEVVGLAGLLSLPEVMEVLAYARAVANPQDGVSLARILLGPRYRVGFKDLARVGAWAKDRNVGLRDEDADEDTPSFLFAEAIEHLDDVERLSEEGRRRLEELQAELASLRLEARKPVGEFLADIIRRTGLLAELDASPDHVWAAGAKRNLAAFLDEVHGFSPVEGELTLKAFLDYVDTVRAGERQEWSPVQPSGDDSVKVMTIHQAKGLEFPVVFVPGLAKDLLPDAKVQQNPAEKGESLDFELRGDHDILPSFRGSLKPFWQDLRDQALIEERRTLYVALTRARRRLIVSGAHWYGDDTQKPKEPSRFFDELAQWAEETGQASVDRGPEVSAENPLAGLRERFVRDWPGRARPAESDDLFAKGWRVAAGEAGRDPQLIESLVAALPAGDRAAFDESVRQRRTLAAHLVEREAEGPPTPAAPLTVSVGGLIDYARCPKRFYWSAVRPLPRFSGPAARVGTRIHAWIERQAAGQATLFELDEHPDLSPEELVGEPGKLDRLQRAFLDSRFAAAPPLYAERPFLLSIDGFTVSGRIDAIFGPHDGQWEVVDYKTGKRAPDDDPLSGLQLDVYALACTEVWKKRAQDLSLTYFYLATGEEVTRAADDPEATRGRVRAGLQGIAQRAFDPVPGDQCRWCDFLPFCDAGREHVGSG